MTDTTEREPLTDEDLAALNQLALERTKRKESAEADLERVKEIDSILRNRLPQGTTSTGACKVTVSKGRQSINADRFAAAFPPDLWPQVYRTVPLAKTDVEQQIAPAMLAAAGVFDDGTPSVTVR